jgi:hypothetical protein
LSLNVPQPRQVLRGGKVGNAASRVA